MNPSTPTKQRLLHSFWKPVDSPRTAATTSKLSDLCFNDQNNDTNTKYNPGCIDDDEISDEDAPISPSVRNHFQTLEMPKGQIH